MANNFVAVDTGKRLGSSAFNAVSQLGYALDSMRLLKNVMDNMTAGADYTIIEAQFGLAAGKGSVFYQYVTGAVNDLTVSTFVQPLIYALGVGR